MRLPWDAFKEKDELDTAIVAYKAAIYLEINPNQKSEFPNSRSTQYSSIGDELFKKAYFKEAESAYRKALAIEPENSYIQDRLKAVRSGAYERIKPFLDNGRR